MTQSPHILDALFATIQAKAADDPKDSYTASLLAKAPELPARKVTEEAVEVLIEALNGDSAKLASESADLLYHLLVVWQAGGVQPDDVWAILAKRQGLSGHEEKASRTKTS